MTDGPPDAPTPPPTGPPPTGPPPTAPTTPPTAPPPTGPPSFPGFTAPAPVTPPGAVGFPSAPPYAAPPPFNQPGAEAAEPAPRKRGRGPVVAFFVILLLVAGVVIAFLVTTVRSGSGPTTTIDTCRIDADGSLTAAGRVSGATTKATLTVEFRDTKGNTLVDSGRAVIDVRDDRPTPWRVTGKAGDSVQRVTCTVTEVRT